MSEPTAFECLANDYILCPYCGHKFVPDEGCYYDESYTEHSCDECERDFDVRVSTSTTWTTTKKESIK